MNINTTTTEPKKLQIKLYSQKELAQLYEVSPRTLKKWIEMHDEKIGKKNGRYYSLAQIELIFNLVGIPKDYCI